MDYILCKDEDLPELRAKAKAGLLGLSGKTQLKDIHDAPGCKRFNPQVVFGPDGFPKGVANPKFVSHLTDCLHIIIANCCYFKQTGNEASVAIKALMIGTNPKHPMRQNPKEACTDYLARHSAKSLILCDILESLGKVDRFPRDDELAVNIFNGLREELQTKVKANYLA